MEMEGYYKYNRICEDRHKTTYYLAISLPNVRLRVNKVIKGYSNR